MRALAVVVMFACGNPEPVVADAAAVSWAEFGTPVSAEPVIEAALVLADPAPFEGKTVRVSGRIADVCQKAGCWMVIAEGDDTMRIRMKEHGFSVAKDAAGSLCEVEGTVVSMKIDPETVAHFEGEAGEGAPIPERQAKGEFIYEIEATGVRVQSAGT